MATDDQSVQPSEEDQAATTSENVGAINVLTKQVSDLTEQLATSEAQNKAAIQRMHESTQEEAALRREKEEREALSDSLPSREEWASMLDDPEKLGKFMVERDLNREKLADEKQHQALTSFGKEVASAIVDLEGKFNDKFKGVDPSLNSKEFQDLKARFDGTGFSDDQLLMIMEKDGKSRAPGPAAGTTPAVGSTRANNTEGELTGLAKDVYDKTFGSYFKNLDAAEAARKAK
jgi:hypothetical protein